MHVRELVELGALVAAHGSRHVQDARLLNQRHMEQYWLASRGRHDGWFQAMKVFEEASPMRQRFQWSALRGTVEEIIAGELLTRIWSAVACCHDQHHGLCDFQPIVRSVLLGHVEARNRALRLLVKGSGFGVDEGARLNRLCHQTERWTDTLLGYLAGDADVCEFAFCKERAMDFAADLQDEQRAATNLTGWDVTLMSLRNAFDHALSPVSPHADFNERIAASILACFHANMLDSAHWLRSSWLCRMGRIAEETHDLVEHLLQLDEAAALRPATAR